MSDTVIKVEGVSKKYCRSLKHTMLYGMADLTRSFVGLNRGSGGLREGEFWAIDDVSFEVKRGECLGIIGPNGSGKSTILKMLNGIMMPDKGRIEVNGRVGALIEVGAGFHPMLTGRENIYINAAILGMSKTEIDKKFDEIVDFAGIGEFIDSPVKHYSSGMYVRLGFAIAVHCEPDILLIDEVLAVGDMAFQNKCLNVISSMVEYRDKTIIFVSHDMNAIRLLCDRCLLLNTGEFLLDDSPTNVIDNLSKSLFTRKNTFQSDILKISFLDNKQNPIAEIDCKDTCSLLLEFKNIEIEKGFMLAFSFVNLENKFSYRLETDKFRMFKGKITDKKVLVHFKEINLPSGTYTVRIAISDGSYLNRKYHFENTIYFTIRDNFKSSRFLQAEWGEIN